MDKRLIGHYNRELAFVQEMGGEFARQFPKVAGRLGMEGLECADPYVERLIESFAFLTARIQLKLEDEFPQFCQHLLEIVYPDYLAALPSMAVVQMIPNTDDAGLARGHVVERGSAMRSGLGKDIQTPCEFRTAHEVTLFPLTIDKVEYIGTRAQLAKLGVRPGREVMAGIRICLKTTGGVEINELQMEHIPLFAGGSGTLAMTLFEHIVANVCGLSVATGTAGDRSVVDLDDSHVRPAGFDASEALLNYRSPSFEGFRLLREYFAFPERYRFLDFSGLRPSLERGSGDTFELLIHLSARHNELEGTLGPRNFLPFCTPVINLFPKRTDRVRLNDRDHEFHIIPDRSRPMDYEIHQVLEVKGFGSRSEEQAEFLPFYALRDRHRVKDNSAFYTLQRRARLLSSRQKLKGARSRYLGQELFISLVDGREAPYASDLEQLGIKTMCTNRDLPLHIPLGQKGGDFFLEESAPVREVEAVAGPTRPTSLGLVGESRHQRAAATSGELAWRVINHLSLNYLSLIENDEERGAAALREMLELYSNGHKVMERQINGITAVNARAVTRRLDIPGPISYGRGLEIVVSLDESVFEAGGMVMLGMVLSEFFRKYVSVNNVTETIIRTDVDGEVARWPVKMGRRPEL